MRAFLRCSLATLFVACSSSGAPVVSTTIEPGRIDSQLTMADPSVPFYQSEDHPVMSDSILAPLDTVWMVLPGVFAELGVEPNVIEQKPHVIANLQFTVRRTLGDVRISKYLDCGKGINGPVADQMQITMSLVVQAVGDPPVTALRTQILAHGVPEALSGNQVNCSTTGALEERIARMVNDDITHRRKSAPASAGKP
ncbi:MAG TPA: hypothetical protein VMT93_01845 [Gemmatimonadaceae bacterium]|nr:hypothetical protein [Gemmatimonadaceae bacterium]